MIELCCLCTRDIEDPFDVCNWQRALCSRLGLTGKVRVGQEGINATVAGSKVATDIYMEAFLKHHLFSDMTLLDFKVRFAKFKEVTI